MLVRVGISLPLSAGHQDISGIPQLAQAAERLGAASLWVADRLLAPVHPTVGYLGTTRPPSTPSCAST